MKIRLNKDWINQFSYVENKVGTVTITEGLLKMTNEGTSRKTRWFPVSAGDQIEITCLMRGNRNVKMNLYSSSRYSVENIVSSVSATDANNLKMYKLVYSVPIDTPENSVLGIGFLVQATTGYFYNPEISFRTKIDGPPNIIACGRVTGSNLNAEFPNYNISNVERTSSKIRVSLKSIFKNNNIKPLIIVTEQTPSTFVKNLKMVVSEFTIVNGSGYFWVYFINANNDVVNEVNAEFDFTVIM